MSQCFFCFIFFYLECVVNRLILVAMVLLLLSLFRGLSVLYSFHLATRKCESKRKDTKPTQRKITKATTIFRVALTWYWILHRTNSHPLTIYDIRNARISALTRTPQTISGFACAHDIPHFIILLSLKKEMISTRFSVVHGYEGMWRFFFVARRHRFIYIYS